MRSATPPQMKPVVSVATTSGTREKTTMRPFTAPIAAPARRTATARSRDCSKHAFSIVRAARTLATAIMDPIERSIPPAITTTACAAAAKASGSAPIASDWRSKSEKVGWMTTVIASAAINRAGIPNRAGSRRTRRATRVCRRSSVSSDPLSGHRFGFGGRGHATASSAEQARARRAAGWLRRPARLAFPPPRVRRRGRWPGGRRARSRAVRR